jgi:hypothetical protein
LSQGLALVRLSLYSIGLCGRLLNFAHVSRLKVIHSADQDIAELFYLETNEGIARGTRKDVEEVLARLVREEACVGTISALRRH